MMKNSKLILVVLVFLLTAMGGSPLLAQNPMADTLVWQTNEEFSVSSGTRNSRSGQVITYGLSKIEWVKADQSIESFETNSYEGFWNDLDLAGSITLRFVEQDKIGYVKMRRDQEIMIQISYVESGVPEMIELLVANIVKIKGE